MHRYTRLYSELLEVWANSRSGVRRIEISFLIPQMPAGTFRSRSDSASSGIYDIGCYPVSLLADIGLGDARLEISEVQFADDPERTRVRIGGSAGEVAIGIDIGVADAYANFVRLHLQGGDTVALAPFFYGRKGERSIAVSSGGDLTARTFEDENAFEVMLARPREAWLRDQAARSRQMVEVAAQLERLASDGRRS